MKVLRIQQIPNLVKTIAVATPIILATSSMKAQNFEQKADVFEKSNITYIEGNKSTISEVKPIVIGDEDIYPALILDKSKGHLYHYDLECYLLDKHNLSSNNKLSNISSGLKRIVDIEIGADSTQNKLILENIDIKNGKTIGTDIMYLSEDNNQNSTNNFKNNIKLPKESLDFLINNLYKEQYLLVK